MSGNDGNLEKYSCFFVKAKCSREKRSMFQIAICDDDKIFCEYFRECLEAVIKKMNIECNISIWYSGAQLQEHLINKNRVDLIFLDIVLVESNGVSIGKFIRENLLDYQVQIVYISNESGYAMQLFEIYTICT